MQLASVTGSLDTSKASTSSDTSSKRKLFFGKSCSLPKQETNASLYSLTALQDTLECNPQPLQDFAALKDFSGENISFLTYVAKWKAEWNNLRAGKPFSNDLAMRVRRQQFNFGLQIFAALISPDLAEFPINVSSTDSRNLRCVFEGAAIVCYGRRNSTESSRSSPFEDDAIPEKSMFRNVDLKDNVWYWGPIPDIFDEKVFDDAERSVKYLVLTHIWPNFLKHYFKHHDERHPYLC